jgi:hypothetical protein
MLFMEMIAVYRTKHIHVLTNVRTSRTESYGVGYAGLIDWLLLTALQAFEKVWPTYQSKGTNSSECLLALLCLRALYPLSTVQFTGHS